MGTAIGNDMRRRDFTLNFRAAGMAGGTERAGGINPEPGPSGSLSLNDALTKQLRLRQETLKRPAPVEVIDHRKQKPTDNGP
jgi:uncharacterized protein (TIGR03435 family)